MKSIHLMLALAGVAAVLSLGAGNAAAQNRRGGGQGGGNFDPEQFRQRMLDRYKEQLEVKNDDEWKVISGLIEKVTTAQRETRIGGFGGFGGGRRGGGGGTGGDTAAAGGGNNRNPFGGEPNVDAEALQKALEAKASSDEIKSKLAKLRDAQKEKEAKLAKAQDELRKVLSVRQEATAVMMGLLK
jgi:hypothetical protein